MSAEQIRVLENGYKHGRAHFLRQRCLAVLLKSQGLSSPKITEKADLCQQSINKWVDRFLSEGIKGLENRPGQGSKPIISREANEEIWFITNEFDLSAKEIADAYKHRWDIEAFFRFIKQELNVSHLVSLNKNGMEVMLYMTLIVAMLVLIYKHANNTGYKTAKKRFTMEMRNLVISMIVVEWKGGPSIFFKT